MDDRFSPTFTALLATLPAESQFQFTTTHIAPLLSSLSPDLTSPLLETLKCTSDIYTARLPRLNLSQKKDQVARLLDTLSRHAKTSLIHPSGGGGERDEIMAEIVDSVCVWLEDIWCAAWEFGCEFAKAHACLLYCVHVLDMVENVRGGCKCTFDSLPIYISLHRRHTSKSGSFLPAHKRRSTLVKSFSFKGASHIPTILLFIWRDLLLRALSSPSSAPHVPDMLFDIQESMGWKALESLVDGGIDHEWEYAKLSKTQRDRDDEDEYTDDERPPWNQNQTRLRSTRKHMYSSDSDGNSSSEESEDDFPSSNPTRSSAHWPATIYAVVPTLVSLVSSRLLSLFKITPSWSIYLLLDTINHGSARTHLLSNTISFLYPLDSKGPSAALATPEAWIAAIDIFTRILREGSLAPAPIRSSLLALLTDPNSEHIAPWEDEACFDVASNALRLLDSLPSLGPAGDAEVQDAVRCLVSREIRDVLRRIRREVGRCWPVLEWLGRDLVQSNIYQLPSSSSEIHSLSQSSQSQQTSLSQSLLTLLHTISTHPTSSPTRTTLISQFIQRISSPALLHAGAAQPPGPVAFAAMMMGMAMPGVGGVMQMANLVDAQGWANANAAAAAVNQGPQGAGAGAGVGPGQPGQTPTLLASPSSLLDPDPLNYLSLEHIRSDPDLTPLRDLYRPKLKQRLECWVRTAALCKGGQQVLREVYETEMSWMSAWVECDGVVEALKARISGRPSKVYICHALDALADFANAQTKRNAVRQTMLGGGTTGAQRPRRQPPRAGSAGAGSGSGGPGPGPSGGAGGGSGSGGASASGSSGSYHSSAGASSSGWASGSGSTSGWGSGSSSRGRGASSFRGGNGMGGILPSGSTSIATPASAPATGWNGRGAPASIGGSSTASSLGSNWDMGASAYPGGSGSSGRSSANNTPTSWSGGRGMSNFPGGRGGSSGSPSASSGGSATGDTSDKGYRRAPTSWGGYSSSSRSPGPGGSAESTSSLFTGPEGGSPSTLHFDSRMEMDDLETSSSSLQRHRGEPSVTASMRTPSRHSFPPVLSSQEQIPRHDANDAMDLDPPSSSTT